ncbi:hypothetical protein EYF80_010555 [Liparis tanakae]|uniref:Uncharacterized protein n=1 Tax=Liparis tanakae TaxID=230148 RepID=A0A4Z2IMP8_9TELE|nr:hypothetical protein EYF80_010555 [Liparis tanakae]
MSERASGGAQKPCKLALVVPPSAELSALFLTPGVHRSGSARRHRARYASPSSALYPSLLFLPPHPSNNSSPTPQRLCILINVFRAIVLRVGGQADPARHTRVRGQSERG